MDLMQPPHPMSLLLRLRTLSFPPFLSPSSILLLSTLLLSLLHLSGLLLFTQGFLLRREELGVRNDCSPSILLPPLKGTTEESILDQSCSLLPTHSKAIILIIDALRSDFIFPQSPSSPSYSPYYHNHIPLPYTLTTQHPSHSFLSHFIADPPTTTLQRLKALTTGSLPTFVDLGSNFAGERIGEDNWLDQAKRAGKKVGMVGDDTWLNVFPQADGQEGVWAQNLTYPYDSFNVEDLDTVDIGVRSHLLRLLSSESSSEWDILIAHSLGLDHSAHRYSPSHSESTRKLQEVQSLLLEVTERLDEDTLLVVMGDHGMTENGDHGGDSEGEVDSVVWFYSKSPNGLRDLEWEKERESVLERFYGPQGAYYEHETERGQTERERSINQVDFVPTFSLLMGLPIPFGNLGIVIPELFYYPSKVPKIEKSPSGEGGKKFARNRKGMAEWEEMTPLQTLLQATLLTSSQLSKYLNHYSLTSKDFLPHLPELTFLQGIAKSHYLSSFVPGISKAEKIEKELKALEKYTSYERKTRERARGVWAKFDNKRIYAGLGVGVGSLALGGKLVGATKDGMRARFVLARALEGLVIALAAWVGVWGVGGWGLKALEAGKTPVGVAGVLAIGGIVGGLVSERTQVVRHATWQNLAALVPLLGHTLFFTSNSFIVWEDSTILFILSTLLIISFVKALSAPEKRLRNRLMAFTATALVLVRLMSYSTICREEQGPECVASFSVAAGSTKGLVLVGLAALFGWFIPTALRRMLELSASDTALAPAYLGWGVRFFLLVGVGYWSIDWMIAGLSLDEGGKKAATLAKTGLARIVLVGAPLMSTLIYYYSPLCLRVQRETTTDASGGTRTQIKFIGFANAFGSSYLLFFASAFSLLWLVNPPQGQIVLGLQLLVLLCLLEIFDTERDVEFLKDSFSSASIEQLLNNEVPKPPSHSGPTFVQIAIVASLAHLAFFATGHQAALSTINWSTAFIGFPTVVYPFSPLLVILNTLAPFILTALSIPLFVFWNLSPTLKDQPSLPLVRNLIKASTIYMTYQAAIAFSSAFWASYFRRHLMVWKVFAPRFMTGAITMLATDVFVVLAGGVALWTMGKAKATLGTKVSE